MDFCAQIHLMMWYTSSSHYGMTVIIRKTLSEMFLGHLYSSGTNRPEMFMYVNGRVIVNVDMVRKSVNKF